MTDAKSRDLERKLAAGDVEAAAAVLRERMRAGEAAHVELAARLGHTLAQRLCPDAEPLDWSDDELRLAAIQQAARLEGKTLPAQVAADWAERALPVWEKVGTGRRPHEAIEAVRAWVAFPCEEHRRMAGTAGRAARVDPETLSADLQAPILVAGLNGRAAANAANAAFLAAVSVDAEGVKHQDETAREEAFIVYAAEAASRAAAAAVEAVALRLVIGAAAPGQHHDEASEREWQRLRLAAYVLDEV